MNPIFWQGFFVSGHGPPALISRTDISLPPSLVHHWQMAANNKHRLDGKKILVTRSVTQAEQTGAQILQRGGIPLYLPCLELERLDNNIRRSLSKLQHDRINILFTSSNGAHAVAESLGSAFSMLIQPHKIFAVGEKTGDTLRSFGIKVDVEPEDASQAGLIELFESIGAPEHLLFYRAEEGSDALADAITNAGGSITTVHAYRMRCPDADASETTTSIQRGEMDAVLLGSAKTVANYIHRIGSIDVANVPAIAVISDQVAKAAATAGLSVQAVAKSASFDAMLDALSNYFQENGA